MNTARLPAVPTCLDPVKGIVFHSLRYPLFYKNNRLLTFLSIEVHPEKKREKKIDRNKAPADVILSSLGRVYVDIVYLFQKNRRILVSFYSCSRGAEVVVAMFF